MLTNFLDLDLEALPQVWLHPVQLLQFVMAQGLEPLELEPLELELLELDPLELDPLDLELELLELEVLYLDWSPL